MPIWDTKGYGGSKAGTRGVMIGVVTGIIFFPPLGIIFGPFLGALTGEIVGGTKHQAALKIALGSFIGFLIGTGLKLFAAITLGYYFIMTLI